MILNKVRRAGVVPAMIFASLTGAQSAPLGAETGVRPGYWASSVEWSRARITGGNAASRAELRGDPDETAAGSRIGADSWGCVERNEQRRPNAHFLAGRRVGMDTLGWTFSKGRFRVVQHHRFENVTYARLVTNGTYTRTTMNARGDYVAYSRARPRAKLVMTFWLKRWWVQSSCN